MTAAPATREEQRRRCEEFFGRPAVEVAPGLLGSRLSHGRVVVELTEVEAYAGLGDPASHAYRGSTPRTSVMFGPPGAVYVYFVYGAHWAINLVCEVDGVAAACLVRAGRVVAGFAEARSRRGHVHEHRLASGPGNLTSALGVTGALTGSTLWAGPVHWEPATSSVEVVAGPRVGVTRAADVPWRFWVAGDPSVSAYRRHTPRRRPRA